jgi:hypothetical protein
MLLFNDLLAEENIDLSGVLCLRHTPWERQLRKVLPWLAERHPGVFNAYQSTQPDRVEAEMLRAKHVASFIGFDKRKDSTAQTAVFVGLYQVGDHRPLTRQEFWRIPAYQTLKQHGMKGFDETEKRRSVLWFDLATTDFYKNWQGKLVVEWPPPPIKWSRFANKAKFPIHAILEESVLHGAMPDWKDCIWSWAELNALPHKWRESLRQWRGIYYIFDRSDGKGYVGAAYGKDNILGRWERYAVSGHGGNVLLRERPDGSERPPENLIFSILERVSPDMDQKDIVDLESNWKERLHTRAPLGLNDN